MAKTRQQKTHELDALVSKWGDAKSVVLAQTMGLTVPDAQALRKALKAASSEMVVAKKTLVRLLLEQAQLQPEEVAAVDQMEGGVTVIFGYGDEVAAAKAVATFAKDHEVVTFHAGVLEGKMLDQAAVTQLSKLPSKDELLARLVGSLASPLTGLVNVLSGPSRGLVQVLSQIKDQKPA